MVYAKRLLSLVDSTYVKNKSYMTRQFIRLYFHRADICMPPAI